jgi:hypothetical protein
MLRAAKAGDRIADAAGVSVGHLESAGWRQRFGWSGTAVFLLLVSDVSRLNASSRPTVDTKSPAPTCKRSAYLDRQAQTLAASLAEPEELPRY